MKRDRVLKEWLEQCPYPVVADIIDDSTKLRHMMISSYVYEEDVLVVIDLKAIAEEFIGG